MSYYRPESDITLSAWRSYCLLGLILFSFLGLVIRAVYLQGMNNEFLREEGELRSNRTIDINVHRGMIQDRHGEVLAVSTPVASVYIEPKKVVASYEQLKELSAILRIDIAEIQKDVARQNRSFVYLKRKLLPEVAEKIRALGVTGVFIEKEFKRYYPAGEVTAHLLGITDINDQGQEGIEQAWQETLTGEPGRRRVIQNRKGHIIESVENIRPPRQGQDLVLSLDNRLQYLAHRALKKAVEKNKAKAGGVVVLDAQTGEVLALVNLPVYNPNRRSSISVDNLRNRALTDAFEPGSTLKPFAVAIALEVNSVSPDTIVSTTPGKLKVGRATISDSHDRGDLTVSQIIQESSNVGTAKIALSLTPKIFWNMLNSSGFGVPTGIAADLSVDKGFPGEARGRLRSYSNWREIEQATMSYGHGISVSLLQLARAYTLFTTGGELMPVSLVKRESPVVGTSVISNDTALAMSNMLEMVVQPGGTAPLAQVNGYRVAGKTGTAHKVINGSYAKNLYLSSFVGYAPASDPRLIIAVMLDEPSAGKYYGGTVAAPVFSQIMAGALRMLNVPHDAPTNNVVSFPAAIEIDG